MHFGVILDGNRRYAEKKKLFPKFMGHVEGKKALEKVLTYWAEKMKEPKYLTLYVFSLYNLKQRSFIERQFIFKLLDGGFRELIKNKEVHKNKIHVSFIGKITDCPRSLQRTIKELESKTADYTNKFLTFCICYDGQEEIADAVNSIPRTVKVDVNTIKKHLYTKKLPPVDLVIRTGGEKRISGFLLWDASYAELIFRDETWPEYTPKMFESDLAEFRHRKRRFGK